MKRNPDGTWPQQPKPIVFSSVNYNAPGNWIIVNTNGTEYHFMCYEQQWYAQKVTHMFPSKEM